MYGGTNAVTTTGPWILDSMRPEVSYSSWFDYPEKQEDNAEAGTESRRLKKNKKKDEE